MADPGFYIRWKNGCFYELRALPGVIGLLEVNGRQRVQHANATLKKKDGYKMSSRQGAKKPQGRWRVTVFTATAEAKRSNARHNTLVKVL
jgi:hypothetical protein